MINELFEMEEIVIRSANVFTALAIKALYCDEALADKISGFSKEELAAIEKLHAAAGELAAAHPEYKAAHDHNASALGEARYLYSVFETLEK